MWSVELAGEALHYADDNWPYMGDVIQALDSLSKNKDGLPVTGAHNDNGDTMFLTVHHMIVYRRYPQQRKIVVSIIKPR